MIGFSTSLVGPYAGWEGKRREKRDDRPKPERRSLTQVIDMGEMRSHF